MKQSSGVELPGILETVRWARKPQFAWGLKPWATVLQVLRVRMRHQRALRLWASVVMEMRGRGISRDPVGEFMRVHRPAVHKDVGFDERVQQLVDHLDWFERSVEPSAFQLVMAGRPVVLAELPVPKGYQALRVQMRRAPLNATEGELLLQIVLIPFKATEEPMPDIELSSIAWTRLDAQSTGCLAIGGVRGTRSGELNLSEDAVRHMLFGWRPQVLLMRFMKELAVFWDLHLLGLDSAFHRLNSPEWRHRSNNRRSHDRITSVLDGLWAHFKSTKGPPGWRVIPRNVDEDLEATSTIRSKRARQALRTDYWIRLQRPLKESFKRLLLRPGPSKDESHITFQMSLGAPVGVR